MSKSSGLHIDRSCAGIFGPTTGGKSGPNLFLIPMRHRFLLNCSSQLLPVNFSLVVLFSLRPFVRSIMDKAYLWLVFLIVALNIGLLWQTCTKLWSRPKRKPTLRVIGSNATSVGKLACKQSAPPAPRSVYFELGVVHRLMPGEFCIPTASKKPHTPQQGLGKPNIKPAIQGESNVLKCNFRRTQQEASAEAKKGSAND